MTLTILIIKLIYILLSLKNFIGRSLKANEQTRIFFGNYQNSFFVTSRPRFIDWKRYYFIKEEKIWVYNVFNLWITNNSYARENIKWCFRWKIISIIIYLDQW